MPDPDIRTVPTTCWECSTCCGALVKVSAGGAIEVAPNPAHPATRGAFCVKGFRGMEGVTLGPNRLLHPLRRRGKRGAGQWERVSWDAALNEMASRLADVRTECGPLAIAGATSGGYFSRSVVHALLLRSIGSPNWMINQDLCGGCRGVSDMVTGLSITGGEDIAHARTVLIVGANPQLANPVQWLEIKRAKQRGARVITIDPIETAVAKLADVWLRPRVGTDAAIALAMINVLVREGRYDRNFVRDWCYGFDRLSGRAAEWPESRAAEVTGVPAKDILTAAGLYAEGPATFVSGHGIDAASNGVQTARAFHALVAISGNLDRIGGNRRAKRPPGFRNYSDFLYDPAFRLPKDVEDCALGAGQFPLWAGPEGWQKACHNPTVINAILTGNPYPVRALYVSGVNIAVTYPDSGRTLEALRSLDFLAVSAHSMNPTAAVADLVFPKTTTLEEEEVSLHAAGPCITYTAAVCERRGEVRPEIEIAADLLDRMEALNAVGKRFLRWRTQREFNDYLLECADVDFDELVRRGYATFDFGMGDFDNQVFRTPSGKVELYSQRMEEHGLDPLPDWAPPGPAHRHHSNEYPFVLQTGLREKTYHHSRFRDQDWAKKVSPEPLLHMHPDTARQCEVIDGDMVQVSTQSATGVCTLKVRVTETVPAGVVATGMGWWRPANGSDDGVFEININAAMSYSGPYDPASGSVDTRSIPCRLIRV